MRGRLDLVVLGSQFTAHRIALYVDTPPLRQHVENCFEFCALTVFDSLIDRDAFLTNEISEELPAVAGGLAA